MTTTTRIICRIAACWAFAALTALTCVASASALAEGRHWELVSPPNKLGASIFPTENFGGITQAAESGEALAYITSNPPVAGAEGNRAFEVSTSLAQRGPSGWGSRDIETPNDEAAGISLETRTAYKGFSGDLSTGLVEPFSDTPLPPLGPTAERTIYLRNDQSNTFEGVATAANTKPGSRLYEPPDHESVGIHVEYAGSSPGLKDVVFATPEALTAGTRNGAVHNLYEWQEGQLRLVSVLPNHEPAAAAGITAELGHRDNIVRGAVSEGPDPRVVWEGHETGGVFEFSLYLRDVIGGETARIDVSQDGTVPVEKDPTPVFRGASADDTRIYFTDEQNLTHGSTARERRADLYVFEVPLGEPLSKGKLIDLTEDENEKEGAPEASAVENVIGYGEQAGGEEQFVYFVAKGVLAPGAQSEADNLYVRQARGTHWEPARLIATLAGEDSQDWDGGDGATGASSERLKFMTARVSPSGRYLAFMSKQPLTGYDNRDLAAGELDEEVFLYDEQTGRLVCASCHLGSRPTGMYDEGINALNGLDQPPFYDEVGAWEKVITEDTDPWLAGVVPGFYGYNATAANYQPRYLLDSGQIFFDSPDSLVPADANGKIDAYEYRPEGSGEQASESCNPTTQSSTEVYRQEAGGDGCVTLLSSGTSNQESVFLDSSTTGKDVFLLTASRLAPQDIDEAFDIYDAHVCTEQVPCAPTPPSSHLPCSDEAGCRGAGGSTVPLTTPPASAGAPGEGNLHPAASTSKPLTKAQKLARALRSCRKTHNKKRRRACEAKARRTYHAKASASHR